ncbi:MAG: GAF domain-containing protein [Anaerolineales bacterium]|nr:GAF domain-containing protein [Anaerolineales bacterium]
MNTSFYQPEEKRYLQFLKAITTFVPALGILAALGYMAIYFTTAAWQMIAAALVGLFAATGFALARILLRKGQHWTAAVITTITPAMTVTTLTLFWSGVTGVIIIMVFVIPNLLVLLGMPRDQRRWIGPLTSLVAVVVIAILENIQPVARLAVTDLAILRWLGPLILVLGGILGLLIMIQGITTGRLLTRLLVAFLIIVLVPMAALAILTTTERIQADRTTATTGLEATINRKETAIRTWFLGAESDLLLVAQDPQALFYMRGLLTRPAGEGSEQMHARIVDRFYVMLYSSNRLREIFLMNMDGIVVADTISIYEGVDHQYQEFFWQGRNGLFLNPPFYFRTVDEITMIVSYPVEDENGQTIGVLAARVNMRQLNTLIALTDTDHDATLIYLVDANSDLLTSTAIGASQQIENAGIRAAIAAQRNGTLEYQNHTGTPVIGTYHWLPEIRSVLLAELPVAVVYAEAGGLLTTSIVVTLAAAVIAVIGALFTIRSLSTPLTTLTNAARQIAAGNLDVQATVENEDEIGELTQTFNDMTSQLSSLVTDLEARVAERTRDLERRSVELQTAAEVARDASIAENMDELLSRAARLIHERFGFYHVGIFLVDENNEFALLRAAGGEAGQLMLASKHKLRVGETGIVGFVTQTGESRIALDTGTDAFHFRNPLLPYTHSEMAIPFKVGDRVIGALDVQSDKTNAFDQNDIAVMQVMSDQLAVAIEKARLLQEVAQSVTEMERSYREYTSRTWRSFIQKARQQQGYRFEGIAPEPIDVAPESSQEVLRRGESVVFPPANNRNGSILAVPVRLRGQTIGTLDLHFDNPDVLPETVALVEEAASRLALALENARLVQDAQRLATRERQVNLITSQIQQATDLDRVLQNTIRELGNTLGVPRTFIQIGLTSSDDE